MRAVIVEGKPATTNPTRDIFAGCCCAPMEEQNKHSKAPSTKTGTLILMGNLLFAILCSMGFAPSVFI
jgi:hypothetical protein